MLFNVYRKSPKPVRKVLNRLSFAPRTLASLTRSKIHMGGYQMRLDFSDNGSFRYYEHRGGAADGYEPSLLGAFLKLISLNPQSYVIDVGASYGAYTLAAASIGKYGLVKKIFAFEPDPRCFNALSKSVSENGFESVVDTAQVALGNFTGETKLLFSERASTSNRTFQSREESLSFSKEIAIKCDTLDARLGDVADLGSSPVIIKIDVEGNELRVFEGMTQLLSRAQGFSIQFEYVPQAMREVDQDPKKLIALIETLGIDGAYLEVGEDLTKFSSVEKFFHHIKGFEGVANYIITRNVRF